MRQGSGGCRCVAGALGAGLGARGWERWAGAVVSYRPPLHSLGRASGLGGSANFAMQQCPRAALA